MTKANPTGQDAADGSTTTWTPPQQGQWTFKDYLHLPDDTFRYEVIDGDLFMTPAPRPQHQKVLGQLFRCLADHVEAGPGGEVLIAPCDLILPERATPVQPDLLYVSEPRRRIVGPERVEGVPDLIAEVLSPRHEAHDRITKYKLYAETGVREYWIVDPEQRQMEIYVLRGNAYAPLGAFRPGERTRSEVLPNFSVDAGDIG